MQKAPACAGAFCWLGWPDWNLLASLGGKWPHESRNGKVAGNLHRFVHRPIKPTQKAPLRVPFVLAGVAGFGPTNARVKVWCLTAWLYPILLLVLRTFQLYHIIYHLSSLFFTPCSFIFSLEDKRRNEARFSSVF